MFVKQKRKRVTVQDGKFNSEDSSEHVALSPTEIKNINCVNLSVRK